MWVVASTLRQMKTVWRYTLADWHNILATPPGSKLLAVGYVHDAVQAWFEVDPRLESTEDRVLDVVPTGGEVPRGMVWFGTVVADQFVFHVYDAKTRGVAARIVARDAEHVTT